MEGSTNSGYRWDEENKNRKENGEGIVLNRRHPKTDDTSLADDNEVHTQTSRHSSILTVDSSDRPKEKKSSVQIKDAPVEIPEVELQMDVQSPLLYKVSDKPPWYLTLFFGFQQTLLSIAGSLIVPYLVADAVCAANDDAYITRILSATMIMNGITSLMQTMLGVRLPLFQGPSGSYIVPLIALNEIDKDRCNIKIMYPVDYNSTIHTINEADLQKDLISLRTRELMGPLMLAGAIHCLMGMTGLVGLLMRFIGPITIVPTILLIGIYIVKPAMDYAEVHWGITALTWAVGVALTLYLGHKPMPIPVCTPKRGCHVIKYPLHQVFAILISILVGWAVCGIITGAGGFSDEKNATDYKARTDARSGIISTSDWIYYPYPGQFGSPLFSVSAFVGFMIATITSILDSIGDYYACAGMVRAPPPPAHAVNRGIAVEGFCTIISGSVGIGHATTTYGGNIGAMGMTKVASRHVFVTMSIIYIVFGLFGKVSAIFVSIPYPVLGGVLITIIGVFVGVNLSNLNVIDLSSTRNLSIMGTAIFVGLLVPSYIEKYPGVIKTGNEDFDQVLTVLLGNPNFFGGVLACLLDNTIPGTPEERGITAWSEPESVKDKDTSGPPVEFLEGYDIYEPLLPKKMKSHWILKYIPIFPYTPEEEEVAEPPKKLSTDWARRRSSVAVGF